MNTKKIVITLAILCIIANFAAANIVPLKIFNDPDNVYAEEFSVFADVQDMGTKISFAIHNESSVYCSVARVYFDDGLLDSFSEIINQAGKTHFTGPATSPQELPSANSLYLQFETTEGFSMQAGKSDFSNNIPENGVNPGEWVTTVFNLKSGKTFGDVCAGLEDGSLRVGAHIIAWPNGNSYAAVTPEPTTIALLGIGSLLLIKRK